MRSQPSPFLSAETGYPSSANVSQLVSAASNVVLGENPPYTLGDFLSIYPQFGPNSAGVYVVPEVIIQSFIGMASSCVKQEAYGDMWAFCMGLFTAHFLSLFLMGSADPNGGPAAVISKAKSRGLEVSKSVDSVSVSTDYSAITQDLAGWAAWTLTIYGTQFATIAKLVGKGGMYVW